MMKQFIDKLISEFEKMKKMNYEQYENADCNNDRIACISASNAYGDSVKITKRIAEEYKGGWISVKDRLPEDENKDGSWVRCIVKVMRSHYPTSTYDDCDSPYDETIVMCAKYDVAQKIWHLDCDEQLNALIDIDDSPMNGDYVIEWMSLKSLC